MFKRIFNVSLVLIALSVPTIALAQFGGTKDLVREAGGVINNLITIVFALGLLVFFWGIVKYISAAGDPVKAKEGKSIMTWGVIGMFVMASIWGIVRFIGSELQIDVGGDYAGDDFGCQDGQDGFGNQC